MKDEIYYTFEWIETWQDKFLLACRERVLQKI